VFSLREPWHGISFAIGEGEDGSPLLSYSVVHAFYMLPDGAGTRACASRPRDGAERAVRIAGCGAGTKWAEHTDLCDVDDLRAAGKRAKLPFRQLTEDLRCVRAARAWLPQPAPLTLVQPAARAGADGGGALALRAQRPGAAGGHGAQAQQPGRRGVQLPRFQQGACTACGAVLAALTFARAPPLQLDFDRRALAGTLPPEAYFVRNCFDPAFMRLLGPWSLPPPLGST
jgi:hypothetical protein